MNGSCLPEVVGDLALDGDAGRASIQGLWPESGREPPDPGCRKESVNSVLSCCPMLLLRGGNRPGAGAAVFCGAGDMRLCA